MVCLCCSTPTRGHVCHECAGTFRPAPERLLPGGIRLVAPFDHVGAARVLMHHLKYRGITDFADLAADVLASRVPRLPLVPVPRALSRRIKYGVDPARVIARALADRIDVPVLDAVTPHLHTKRRAGHDHSRPVSSFKLKRRLPSPVVVVDDVVTTGATVLAVVEAVGPDRVGGVAAANMVTEMSNLDVA